MQNEHDLAYFLAQLRQHMPLLAERYHVHSLGVFGSYARHEQSDDSDVDLLVSFDQSPGLLKFIELENYLSDLLGVQVDLVMKDALKPALGQFVAAEVVMV